MSSDCFQSISDRWKAAPENLKAFLGILFLLFVFYPTLFLVRSAPLTGDHWEQHYPWAYLLSQSLHQGSLPFWTSLIQSGFPIAAESQIGIFYLPNLILYALLPFHTAYSYMNLIHFMLASWGTYAFARIIRLQPPGAFLAAVIFLFGAAFGGAYYNMTSLKTIAWFPLALFCFEQINQHLKKQNFCFKVTLATFMKCYLKNYIPFLIINVLSV